MSAILDNEELFKRELLPLVEQIYQLCEKHHLAYIAVYQLRPDGLVHRSGITHPDASPALQQMHAIDDAMSADVPHTVVLSPLGPLGKSRMN